MAEDPLYAPLGVGEAPPTRRWTAVRVFLGLGIVVLAGVVAVQFGRRTAPLAPQEAVAVIEPAASPVPPPVEAAARPAPPVAAAATPGGDTVEIQNGVKVIRMMPVTAAGSLSVPVSGGGEALAPAPDPRLVETTRWGMLPRIGADGARPAEVYARKAPAAAAQANATLVAVVMGGMGRDQSLTARLARQLPPAVTFAFPADSPDLPAQVAETRAAGHEVVLQLPADPGQAPEGTDRLRGWLGRAIGYAGVALPAAATPGDAAAEVARRGLYAVAEHPGPERAPAVPPVDVAITSEDAAAKLERLAARARVTGAVIGWAEPGAADALAAAAAGWAGQNVALVPLSAVADRPKILMNLKSSN